MTAMSAHAHDHSHDHGHGHADSHGHHVDLSESNTSMPAGWGKTASLGLLALGAILSIATLVPVFTGMSSTAEDVVKAAKHAMASYHTGFVIMLGLTLGPLGLVLVLNLVKAGWAITIRRQLENMASLVPVAVVLLVPTIVATMIKPDILFKWMSADPAIRGDALLQAKSPFLNPAFFYIRLAIYFVVWIYLATRLNRLSREQDATGNKQLTVQAGLTSAWGILAFALSVAFVSFDLVKSLDYHWFSTMFGVYFFAGNMVTGIAVLVLTLAVIRSTGRLNGLVTAEHMHDVGKLMLGFTVFWAYVTFSQYFLIWYANIPEETAWYMTRAAGGWEIFGPVLILGHFIVPFLILLWRGSKRTMGIISAVALLLVVMHCLDMFYCIRPNIYMTFGEGVVKGKLGFNWVDITGILGPVLIFVGLLVRKVGSGPLIPLKDPRLAEAIAHKNYV
jgi:hypothetical protein